MRQRLSVASISLRWQASQHLLGGRAGGVSAPPAALHAGAPHQVKDLVPGRTRAVRPCCKRASCCSRPRRRRAAASRSHPHGHADGQPRGWRPSCRSRWRPTATWLPDRGPPGLSDAVLQACQLHLSTLRPHLPARAGRIVLLEQLYRAATIIGGEKYHK
jgi:hypothetical protein